MGFRTDLPITLDLIVVSAIVHNIAVKRNDPLIMDGVPDLRDPPENPERRAEQEALDEVQAEARHTNRIRRANQSIIRARGQAYRERIVQNYF